MREVEYILCHGSGNRFVMIDMVRDAVLDNCPDVAALARNACRLGGGVDGLLLVAACEGGYEMRMFNPDGSAAEMCGNGIRCVARLVAERYLSQERFAIWSAGRSYPITREESIYGKIPTFGAEIPIRRASPDFVLPGLGDDFTGKVLPQLDPAIEFSYLNLGNPHLTACVPQVDFGVLEGLGQRVLELREIFPNGVNVSLFCVEQRNAIFVATYERGVGITPSCGTAMTASSTAACLLGLCDYDADIAVRNRGGMVRCRCLSDSSGLRTKLIGNATYQAIGYARIEGADVIPSAEVIPCCAETEAYSAFLRAVCEN